MKNKIISFFGAAAISIGIGFGAPAGLTAVSSFAFVPEAHAGWYKKAKKAAKKVGRKVKKGGKAGALGAANGIAKVGEYEVRGARAIGRKGRAFGRAAKKVGKEYGKMGRCIVKRRCKAKIGPRQPGTR